MPLPHQADPFQRMDVGDSGQVRVKRVKNTDIFYHFTKFFTFPCPHWTSSAVITHTHPHALVTAAMH
jgi:hypothetical protein